MIVASAVCSPRSGRARQKAATLASASVAAAVALTVAACGSNKPTITTNDVKTKPPASTTVIAGPMLTLAARTLAASQLSGQINVLYRAHPDLRSYVVQGTTYTARSRTVVLKACTAGGNAAMAENLQTSRLDACAPMIFYFYNYGTQRHTPQALKIARDLFTYAVDNIHGPLDSGVTLANILKAWGITVDTAAIQAKSDRTSASATKLLAATDQAIQAQGAVRLTITGRKRGQHRAAEHIVIDVGSNTSHEAISEPDAHAAITVTPTVAFLSGNEDGLTSLLGLTTAQAKRAGSHWISAAEGSKEFTDLAAENTIRALTASILPAASASVRAATRFVDGRLVKVLTWSASVESTSEVTTESLELASGTDPLPVQETTAVGSYQQTVVFSNWNESFSVRTPASRNVVSYASLGHK